MKTSERLQARELRANEGLSINEIARVLEVSRNSVSRWVRDIELTPQQLANLAAKDPVLSGRLTGTNARAEQARGKRLSYQTNGRSLVRLGDPEFVAGCMLFWAEGSRDRNAVRFTNSDPAMMVFFLRFLRRHFEVTDDMVTIWCNLFAERVESRYRIERFWLRTLELPTSSLGKSTVNAYSKHSRKRRTNMLPYGTCRIAVYRTHIVQALYGAIQEFAGFERPGWAAMG
jgi:transcriptional regulator with XRE-family HTH domain